MSGLLLLKLTLVPLLIGAVTEAGRRWGAGLAGFLAGLPIIVGPILGLLAWEQGNRFAADAAIGALAAVPASTAFALAYARTAVRHAWPLAQAVAMLSWAAAAALVLLIKPGEGLALVLGLAAVITLPPLFPHGAANASKPGRPMLAWRMLAGALLTLGITLAAARLGPLVSGLLALFPVMMSVMAIASQRREGALFAARLLEGMVRGMISVVAFCAALALLLPRLGAVGAFTIATVASVLAHLGRAQYQRWRLGPRPA